MKFELIYADPPWDFRSNSEQNVGRNVRGHYNTLDLKRLKSFPVESIAEEDSMIAMWTTGPMLDQAISLMRAWGFKFKGSLFTWIKTTKIETAHHKERWNCQGSILSGKKISILASSRTILLA